MMIFLSSPQLHSPSLSLSLGGEGHKEPPLLVGGGSTCFRGRSAFQPVHAAYLPY